MITSYSFEVEGSDLDGLLDAAFARAQSFFGDHTQVAIEDFAQFDVRDIDGGYAAFCRVAQPAYSREPALLIR